MKKLIITAAFSILAAGAFAQTAVNNGQVTSPGIAAVNSPNTSTNPKGNKVIKDIKGDVKDLRSDIRDIRADIVDLRKDIRQRRMDIKSGDKSAALALTKDIRNDRRDIRMDRRDIRHDKRDFAP